MAFPWGGSLTYSQMAQKFGWPSVLISLILYAPLLLFTKLISFPVWLEACYKHGNMYVMSARYKYENEDFVKDEFYCSLTAQGRFPNGFIAVADTEGGVWIESFWGIIHSLKLECTDSYWMVSPHFVSLLPAYVWIEYGPKPTKENIVRFYFPIVGPNIINPFMWVVGIFATSAIFWLANVSIKPFFSSNGCYVKNQYYPPAEDATHQREDGSIPYVPQVDAADESTPLNA